MTVKVTITVHNAGPHTIWGRLAARLGREPTRSEAVAEVRRILHSATVDAHATGLVCDPQPRPEHA